MEKHSLRLLISEEEIQKKVAEASQSLIQKYQDQEFLIIMIMKGSICFVADLIRQLPPEQVSLEFVRCSSYGKRGTQKGQLVIEGLEKIDVKDRHVLLIDDIFDTGDTLEELATFLRAKQPKDLWTLVLLFKRIKRKTSFLPDQALIEIGDEFVVGYGVDYKERYRGFKEIYVITP